MAGFDRAANEEGLHFTASGPATSLNFCCTKVSIGLGGSCAAIGGGPCHNDCSTANQAPNSSAEIMKSVVMKVGMIRALRNQKKRWPQ